MTAIWKQDRESGDWKLLGSDDYPDEATLHRLIQENPGLLPLAGAPKLVIVGSEVRLGPGYADLVGVESSGRLAVVEIKLARNSEARRAVIGQVLSYAAHLQGLDRAQVEAEVLGKHLRKLGHGTLLEAVQDQDQEGAVEASRFEAALDASLVEGAFRIVIVVDAAPAELAEIAGYLELVADRLVVDLIAVRLYDVDGSKVLVPQRVEPGGGAHGAKQKGAERDRDKGRLVDGSTDFRALINEAPAEHQPMLETLCSWAEQMEGQGLVRLQTFHGKAERTVLLPRFQPENVGLTTIWMEKSGGSLSFWRSVFERRAPDHIESVEAALGRPLGQGNTTRDITPELLEALTSAHLAAVSPP